MQMKAFLYSMLLDRGAGKMDVWLACCLSDLED